MYFDVEQITTDTTSKHIKDYHHKNDRIKDVRIGFEPLSGDAAGWVEDVKGRGGLREREWMFDQRELVEELVASPLGNCMVKVSWELRGSRRSQLVPDTRNGIKFISNSNYYMHLI